MFRKIADLPNGVPCQIIGYGYTANGCDLRLRRVGPFKFIKDIMSDDGRLDLFGHAPPFTKVERMTTVAKWYQQTGIIWREVFYGSTAELAVIAAKNCLAQAKVSPESLGAIIGGTNTGPGYPSLADHIKLGLGVESGAMCSDATEACPTGAVTVLQGWNLIRSGFADKVLVVCAERATTLAPADDWKASNLFGDAAFAFLLSAGKRESFIFFDFQSLPFDGNIKAITKTDTGFSQDGPMVHKFVGRDVVAALIAATERAGIDPAEIKHFVPHQPSGKTLELLKERLKKAWPGFKGQFHNNVRNTGNTSGASTGWLIAKGIEEGKIKKGELIVVLVFGSGLSIGIYGFYA